MNDSRAAYLRLFTELARLNGATDPGAVAEQVQSEFLSAAVGDESAGQICERIAELSA